MAEGTTQLNPTIYSCPICLEKIIRPKRLPCSHTFCEKCLQTFISRAAIGKDPENFDFECPVCRRVTNRPEPWIDVDEWAKYFPTNILVNSLTSSSAEKSEEKSCAICLRDDQKSKAESWCYDCAEAICVSCKRLHQIIGSLQNHKISALSFEGKDDKFTFPELDEPCHLHEGKCVEVCCLDHEKLCCCLCVATQHRQCEHVETVSDVAKIIPKEVVESNLEVLSAISKITKEVLKHKEKTIMLLGAQNEDILKNASNEIAKIKTRLDELEQQFRKTFMKKHEDIEEEMKQCVLDIKQYLLIVNNGEALLSAVKDKGTSTQIFLSSVKIKRDIEDQFNQLKTRNPEDKEYDYKHDHTTILKQFCENDKIDDFRVIVKPTATLWNLSLHMSSFQIFEIVRKIQPSMVFENLSESEALNIEKKGEFELPFLAEQSVFIDNDTLAFASSSNVLSFHNLDGSLHSCVSSLELKGQPYLWTGSTQNVLYVGCHSTIQKLQIRKKYNTINFICSGEVDLKQEFDMFSVDETQNRIIIASQSNVGIFALSPALSLIHTIPRTDSNAIMSISKTYERIAFVQGDGVGCYSTAGNEIFLYENANMKSPKFLAFDYKNNIYAVCSMPRMAKCDRLHMYCRKCGLHNYAEGRKLDTLLRENIICGRCDQDLYEPCRDGRCGRPIKEHLQSGGVFCIFKDGNNSQCLLSNYPGARYLAFNPCYNEFLISDGTKCTIYKLS